MKAAVGPGELFAPELAGNETFRARFLREPKLAAAPR